MSVRLPAGEVTVLLDQAPVRRRLMAMLDDDSGRQDGRDATVCRVSSPVNGSVTARIAALTAARGAALVLVDRLTDGLRSSQRRRVLAALRPLAAAGPAVLVDDADAVAALAVADGTLRADPVRGLVLESANELSDLDYRAS